MKRRPAPPRSSIQPPRPLAPVYPFAAIVGQDEMKLSLLLNAIDPVIGGVLIMGHRGTGKSTAVRALADLLPPVWKVRGCLYGCDPLDVANLCADCLSRLAAEGKLQRIRARVPVVDLPLGATEDRVCGTIDIERALTDGVRAFDPGLLARANRGFLYIDEVNLLEDHLVDLLLDVAVTGRNAVEREGISVEHPARFVLVGSGNPEEGELRPQLLDRFGLHAEVVTANDLEERVQIIIAREAFERDPASFRARHESEQVSLRRKLTRARKRLHDVESPRELLRRIAELCMRLKVDGHRGELTITRAARALAALEGRRQATAADVRRVAMMSLRHRLRRDPLEQTTSGAQIERALEDIFPPNETGDKQGRAEDSPDRKDIPPPDSAGDGGRGTGESNKGAGSNTRGERHSKGGHKQSAAPALDARLPEEALDETPHAQAQPQKHLQSARYQRNSRRSIYNTQRGRYARALITSSGTNRIALDATLRAAALRCAGNRRAEVGGWELGVGDKLRARTRVDGFSLTPNPQPLSAIDLRFKRFKRKVGTLFIFAIDASGSMALNRINQAKGALAHLLKQSYVRRDHVAVVSFHEERAHVLLPPCQSVTRARRILDALCVGGATPLAAGLFSSLEVARRALRHGAPEQMILLLFTDGRANISLRAGGVTPDLRTRRRLIDREIEQLGSALRRAGVASVVVDTQNRFISSGEGRKLADQLGGRYIYFGSNGTAGSEQLIALSLEVEGKRR